MKRFLILLLFGIVLTTGAWADAPPTRPADEARLLENMDLVKNLVKGSLLLAAEDDPLKRADHCNALAIYVASEMEQAADKQDGDRTLELAGYLRALLEQGVASNLQTSQRDLKPGSARDQEVNQLGQQVRKVLELLESHLRSGSDSDDRFSRALQAVHDGKAEVDRALQSRNAKK
ncbi:MAG TPA: hypothetical protein VFA18_19325 [Gemmataceae bacterium]|nr:hypothetical protein [Gemmataceae bacterium]